MYIHKYIYMFRDKEKDRKRDINKIITSMYLGKIKGLVCKTFENVAWFVKMPMCTKWTFPIFSFAPSFSLANAK